MNIKTALGAFESELARGQAERDDVKTSPDDLAGLVRQLSDMPIHEIDKLVDALQALRKKLQNAASRIQRDIAEYAELSEQVMQLTAVICGGVEKLPRGTH
jgi:flagellar biosynthesis chaperone FliJ